MHPGDPVAGRPVRPVDFKLGGRIELLDLPCVIGHADQLGDAGDFIVVLKEDTSPADLGFQPWVDTNRLGGFEPGPRAIHVSRA